MLKTKEGQKFFIYKTEKCDMQKELTETINNLQSQLKAKEEIFEEAIYYIRDCCDMDSKWVNLHYDYAQKEMSADEVDGLLEILSKGENK